MYPVDKEQNTALGEMSSKETAKVQDIIMEKKVREELEKIFADKTVIDLAAGREATGLAVSSVLGAENYVGVEPFNERDLIKFAESRIRAYQEGEKFSFMEGNLPYKHFGKIHISYTDMLTFLQKMPDKLSDVVLLISGVDQFILGTSSAYGFKSREEIEENQKYVDSVHKELLRVLGPNSVLLTYASPEFGFNDEALDQKIIHLTHFSAESDIYLYSVKEIK